MILQQEEIPFFINIYSDFLVILKYIFLSYLDLEFLAK